MQFSQIVTVRTQNLVVGLVHASRTLGAYEAAVAELNSVMFDVFRWEKRWQLEIARWKKH